MVDIAVVCAVAENGVIGTDDGVPWSYPEDYTQYTERVAGHPVIVGRRTFDEMGRLEGTTPIVLTRDPPTGSLPVGEYVSSPAAAVEAAAAHGERAYVIGGAAIYSLFLPHADVAYISEIPERPVGSSLFPYMGTAWDVESIKTYDTFRLVTYTQQTPAPVTGDAGA